MALYQYEALLESGKKTQGLIDADTLAEAKQTLKRRQLTLTHLSTASSSSTKAHLSSKELLYFTKDLSQLLQAGLPLFESLLLIEEKSRGQKTHSIFLSLSAEVKKGVLFSEALNQHGRSFPSLYRSMVANAEKTASITEILVELSHLLQKEQRIKKQFISSLIYPGILALFCLVVLASLLFFVIPSLSSLFEGRSLHPFTHFVVKVSSFACRFKWGLLSCFLIAISSLFFFFSLYKKGFYLIANRISFLRSLFDQMAWSQFSRSCSTLLLGGIPLIEAVKGARKTLKHPLLSQLLQEVEGKVLQGASFSQELRKHPLVPSLVGRMLSVGEKSSEMSFMFKQIAQIYEEDLERSLSQITTFLQPALLLFLGGVIGFVLLSVLLPLTDVGSFLDL